MGRAHRAHRLPSAQPPAKRGMKRYATRQHLLSATLCAMAVQIFEHSAPRAQPLAALCPTAAQQHAASPAGGPLPCPCSPCRTCGWSCPDGRGLGFSSLVAARLGYSSGLSGPRSAGNDGRGGPLTKGELSRTGGTQPPLEDLLAEAQLEPAVNAERCTSGGGGTGAGSSGFCHPLPDVPEGTSWVVGSFPECSCR